MYVKKKKKSHFIDYIFKITNATANSHKVRAYAYKLQSNAWLVENWFAGDLKLP